MNFADVRENVAAGQHESISAFATTVEGTTSLYVLRVVDKAVDTLYGFCTTFKGLAEQASLLGKNVRGSKVVEGNYIDGSGAQPARLLECSQKLEKLLGDFRDHKSQVVQNEEFKPHHCERLHDAYDDVIAAGISLMRANNELRSAVIDHDEKARLSVLKQNSSESSKKMFEKIQNSGAFTVESFREIVTSRRREQA